MEKRNVNIRLPVDLYHRFKVRAAQRSMTIQALMIEAMARVLEDSDENTGEPLTPQNATVAR